MPVRCGNNGMQTRKKEILGLSADDAPVEVPPARDDEVGWMSDGVESSDGVGSDVDAPR